MPGLVSPRQFGTEAYSLGRLPVQQTQLGTLNIRTPDDSGDETPTDEPNKGPNQSGNSKGNSAGSKAGAGVAAGAAAGAGAKSKSMSLLQKVEEPLHAIGSDLASAGKQAGQYIWDATSPNASWRQSGVSQDISKVINFGNPFPAGSPGGPAASRVQPQQFSGVGETTAKSAIGQPEGGFSGFMQGIEHGLSKVGSTIVEGADALG